MKKIEGRDMLLIRDHLPETISDVAALDELLCRPSQALIDDLRKVDGDIMILGVAGKMGPTLAGLAKAALPDRRIIGVARFSDPRVKDWLQARGIGAINTICSTDRHQRALPKIPTSCSWRGENSAPGVCRDLGDELACAGGTGLCRLADRRVLDHAFILFVPVNGKGADESGAQSAGNTHNPASGASACSEYFSRKYSTPGHVSG
jgi:hypothetical protein